MTIIDGKKISGEIIKKLKLQPAPKKIMAAVLVGDNPASISFLKQKEKIAKELNVDFRVYKFPETAKNDELRKEVGKIASLKKVGGVIVQLPLPEHLNNQYVLNAIPREKDVDVLSERTIGAFYAGRNPILPPPVETVIEILKEPAAIKPLAIAVVGLGFLVGRPIALWLMKKCRELYLLDKGSDFKILKQADLVITATGQAGLIKPEMLKESAGIIDFGYSMENANNDTRQKNSDIKIRGDFDSNSLSKSHALLNFYTPTPGGTGPILVAKIFENFYRLNDKQLKSSALQEFFS